MQHGHAVAAEAGQKAPRRLRGQGNLGHEHEGGCKRVLSKEPLDKGEINFRLAGAGDTPQKVDGEPTVTWCCGVRGRSGGRGGRDGRCGRCGLVASGCQNRVNRPLLLDVGRGAKGRGNRRGGEIRADGIKPVGYIGFFNFIALSSVFGVFFRIIGADVLERQRIAQCQRVRFGVRGDDIAGRRGEKPNLCELFDHRQ